MADVDPGTVLPFPQRAPKLPAPHFCGYLYNRIKLLVERHNDQEAITFQPVSQNHGDGSRKVHVRLAGDTYVYEMTLRPVKAGDAA